jgi:TonB-linked SusC/RagA family outer membrane protein
LAEEMLSRGETINWKDAMLHTGHTQNYSLSVSGGTEKTQLYFSLNYSDEQGQYTNDEYKLYSSTIRLNQEIAKWLTAGMHMQASYVDQEKAYSKLDNLLRADPFGSLYEEDGSIKVYPVDGSEQLNLLLNNDKSVYRNNPTKLKLYVQPYIRISPIKGLTLESRLSANYNYNKTSTFQGIGSYQFYQNAGKQAVGDEHNSAYASNVTASITNSDSFSYTWENVLTYNFKIAKNHDFTVTAVSTWSDSKSNSAKASNSGFTTNTYYWTNLAAAGQSLSQVSSGYSMGKSMGYVGRLNYSYLGRYLFSASVRHDGNSKLAKDVRWDTFPAFSAGWRISDERFMEPTQDWLNNLKLRVGYGETGAAGISAYSSWSILQQGTIGLGDEEITSYYYPQKLSNSQLTWERSKNTNIGVDASFLNNRIELTLDYYITNTDDVIWTQSLPVTNGGYSATASYTMDANIAKTKNKGLEATLTTRNIKTKDFSWESTFTFAKNKEKVTSLGEGASEYITHGDYTLHVGDAVKSFYGYKISGVWQYGEEADAAVFGKRPGDLKVDIPNMHKVSDGVWEKSYPKELDEDGNVVTRTFDAENPYTPTDVDRVILGHNSPDWSLGFHNTFTYKAFDLSVYMYWRQGQMIKYDPILWYKSAGGAFPSNYNYWTSTNPSNDFPALDSTRDWTQDSYYSSKAYQDGSFFKIKNITLGYTMPKSICNRIGIQNLRIYGTMTNPYVKAKNHLLKNYDPEMNGSLDFPLTKQLVFGLNLSL